MIIFTPSRQKLSSGWLIQTFFWATQHETDTLSPCSRSAYLKKCDNAWGASENKARPYVFQAAVVAKVVFSWQRQTAEPVPLHPNNMSGNADFGILPPQMMIYRVCLRLSRLCWKVKHFSKQGREKQGFCYCPCETVSQDAIVVQALCGIVRDQNSELSTGWVY